MQPLRSAVSCQRPLSRGSPLPPTSMSLVIDHFGLFGMHQHSLSPGRAIGAALMVGGIALISKF